VLDEFGDDRRTSRLRLAIEVPEHGDDIVSVRAAIVPLYPKLRTDALELVENAGVLLHWIQSLVEPADRIGLETFFNRSGTYLASLYGGGLVSYQESIVEAVAQGATELGVPCC
jgi:hypothetical protein